MITYVFDSSLSPKLSACISALLCENDSDHDSSSETAADDCIVMHVTETDEFKKNEGHAVWIPRASKQNWIVVTCLSKARKKPVGELLAQNAVRAEHLAEGVSALPRFEQASWLIARWEKIVNTSYRLKAGESITIRMNGEVVRTA